MDMDMDMDMNLCNIDMNGRIFDHRDLESV